MADNNIQKSLCLTLLLLTFFTGGCAITQPTANKMSSNTGEAPQQASAESAPVKPAYNTGDTNGPPYNDLWARIRDGFAFPELDSPHVDYYVEWYSERPEHMERMTKRASRYLYYIVEELDRHDIPMEIALLPAIESAFKPRAYSHAHASGLWQFISATGRRYGLKQNWWYDGRRDVIAATDAAIRYLSVLREHFNGDWFHALASYNGGERRVQRAIARNRSQGKPTGYEHLELKRETMRYVPKLIAMKKIVANPQKYGLSLAPIPNEPYFEIVEVGSQVDLGIVAEAAGLSTDALQQLNPGFRRWATDPSGPHRVLVPVEAAERVAAKLNSLPSDQRMRWARHEVRPGDTLSQIARRYGITVQALQSSNRLSGSLIRAGATLVVPVSTASIATNNTGSGQTNDPIVHRVQHGDTLWGIARRYEVPLKQLQHWNEIASNDILRLGQKIMVHLN